MNTLLSRLFITVFSFILFSSSSGYAREALDVGMVDFPPFFCDQGDDVTGLVVDKLKRIVNEAGYDMRYSVYPMKRVGEFAREGLLDFTVVLKAVFKEGEIMASDNTICKINLRHYSIGQKDSIRTVEDLKNKRIGIFRGFTYGGWINYIKDPANEIDYYEVTKHEQLFKMLELGRIDYVLDYRNPSDVVLANMEVPNLYYEDISVMPVYILVSVSSKKNPKEILRRLNKAYNGLIASGEMNDEN